MYKTHKRQIKTKKFAVLKIEGVDDILFVFLFFFGGVVVCVCGFEVLL